MRRLARVLMAGEQVVFMEKPDPKTTLMWEGLLAAAGFVVLFLFLTIFSSDLPTYMRAAMAAVFSLAACGVLHFWMATTTYVITDKRLMVVNDLGSDLKHFCDLEEVRSLRKVNFGKQLVVERANGNPIRLFGLKNRDEAEQVLIGAE
jgi:hypothetical protein